MTRLTTACVAVVCCALQGAAREPDAVSKVPVRAARLALTVAVSVDIDRTAGQVWRYVLAQYDEGESFDDYDELTRLSDGPAALLGGYYVKLLGDRGEVLDERVAYVTERDHEDMRFALFGHYLAPGKGNRMVFPTFRVVDLKEAARLELHLHVLQDVELPDGPDSQGAAAGEIARLKGELTASMERLLRKHKSALEH